MDRGVWWALVHRIAESDTTDATKHAHLHIQDMYTQIKPGGSAVKNPPAVQETRVLSMGLEDPLGEELSYLVQYFSLGNPVDRGAWQAAVCGVGKSQTLLSTSQ